MKTLYKGFKLFKNMNTNKLACYSLLVILLFIFLYNQNNDIVTTNITYKNNKIPKNFNGFKIIQISDLHNKSFGKNQKNLIAEVKKANPDIIVITGDFIDSRFTNVSKSMDFINGAINIAPIYFVSGNHEIDPLLYDEVTKKLIAKGVRVMDNKLTSIEKNGEFIELIGVADPLVTLDYEKQLSLKGSANIDSNFKKRIEDLSAASGEGFKILLSHRPGFFSTYAKNGFDLTLAGHDHGGQIRLPFIGGLFSPSEGFLPKYTNGLKQENNKAIILSRGLGNSLFPQRLFNKPEIVEITLQNK